MKEFGEMGHIHCLMVQVAERPRKKAPACEAGV